MDPLRHDAGTLACLGELVERPQPRRQVGDRVLDVQRRHGSPSFEGGSLRRPRRPAHKVAQRGVVLSVRGTDEGDFVCCRVSAETRYAVARAGRATGRRPRRSSNGRAATRAARRSRATPRSRAGAERRRRPRRRRARTSRAPRLLEPAQHAVAPPRPSPPAAGRRRAARSRRSRPARRRTAPGAAPRGTTPAATSRPCRTTDELPAAVGASGCAATSSGTDGQRAQPLQPRAPRGRTPPAGRAAPPRPRTARCARQRADPRASAPSTTGDGSPRDGVAEGRRRARRTSSTRLARPRHGAPQRPISASTQAGDGSRGDSRLRALAQRDRLVHRGHRELGGARRPERPEVGRAVVEHLAHQRQPRERLDGELEPQTPARGTSTAGCSAAGARRSAAARAPPPRAVSRTRPGRRARRCRPSRPSGCASRDAVK